jgi:hypothetical protein
VRRIDHEGGAMKKRDASPILRLSFRFWPLHIVPVRVC